MKPNDVTLSIRLPAEMAERLRQEADDLGIGRGALLRMILRATLYPQPHVARVIAGVFKHSAIRAVHKKGVGCRTKNTRNRIETDKWSEVTCRNCLKRA